MKEKKFVLICDGMQAKLFEQLKGHTKLEVHPKSKNTRDEIIALGNKVNVMVVRSATKVDAALIDALPNLKLVIRAGEGMDNIDRIYAAKKNITSTNTPGANGNAAAELAISMMMALLRHIPSADQSMRKGQWDKSSFNGQELTHKTIGIVGFGKIGQIVAKRLQGFEVEVLYFDPFDVKHDISYAKAATLNDLVSKSDLISLHLPLIDQTKSLINLSLMQKMKKTALIINCARGGIIVEEDLIKAINDGVIAAAALDVFSHEPLPENSPLRSCSKILLTPHLGASTAEAEWRVGEMALNIIDKWVAEQ